MEKEILKQIILEQKSIFEKDLEIVERKVPKNVIESPKVVVITGIRRCGKSTLLRQISKNYNIYNYVNFEDERFLDFSYKDFNTLLECFLELYPKSNVFFFDEIQNAIKNHSEMQLEEIYIDNMAQQMVVNPQQFNNSVLVSTNLFMDIISELASGIVGSIGLVYSSNMGESYAMFEAAHGSAPSFKGQNKVNPTATVLAGAWMAEYLGETDVKNAIFSATHQVINDGKYATFDIGGDASTTQMSEQIAVIAKNSLRK